MPVGPYSQDVLTRIYDVHWEEEEQQGLLATKVNTVEPIAIALDTGDEFKGVMSGASGTLLLNTFTVLSLGVVVYGKPRDGDACFMASINGTSILRGIQLEDGDKDTITWKPVFSVPHDIDQGWGLTALSFASDAFFVAYGQKWHDSESTISCAASFDGLSFKDVGDPYSGVPTTGSHFGQMPGSVAHNGEGVYASVGIFTHDDNYPEIITSDNNMMWGKSDGRSWSDGFSYPEIADPGIRPDSIRFPLSSVSQAYTTVAGGAGLFVAAATAKSAFKRYTDDVVGDTSQDVRPTAAAAVSSDGHSWNAVKLPGAFEANHVPVVGGGLGTINNESTSLSVAFIRTGKDTEGGEEGYFVISASGAQTTSGSPTVAGSWCWKGDVSSGTITWTMVKSADEFSFGTVSAIAKDLNSTKIVLV